VTAAPPRRLPLPAATPRRLAALILAGALALLAASFALWIREDFTDTEVRARVSLQGAALLLEEHVLRSLAGVDAALQGTVDLARELGTGALGSPEGCRRLDTLARLLPPSGAIFVYDGSGNTLLGSSDYPPPSANAADRDYFSHLMAGGAEPYIGRALRGRTVHRFFFPVARTIRNSAGAPEGVAQVGVEVDYLADLFRHAGLAPQTAIGLYRLADGALVARHPMGESLLDESLVSEPYFRALADPETQWSGWTQGRDRAERRLVAARRVRGLPLVLAASLPESAVLGPARGRLTLRLGALAGAAAILGLLGLLLRRSLARESASQGLRAAAERLLAESELRYRLLFEANPNPMLVFDEETLGLLAANDQALRFYGWSREELLGMSILDIRPPEDRELARTQVARNPNARECQIGPVRHRLKDGKVRRVEIVASSVDFAGRPGRLCCITDLTDRLIGEAALAEASRRKDEFLATLAHELRNPLTPIRTGLELLRLKGDDPQIGPKARAMMERQLGHLVRLVDDLLDVSRIARGKIELRREPLDLGKLAAGALELASLSPAAAERRLESCLPEGQARVWGDPVRLTQILGNLLDNALKFTAPGARIRLSVACQGGWARVSVTDDGEGIPPERLSGIFDLFSQVHPAKGGGLGIGLALVRALVGLHGGQVWARSAGPGQGSEFVVELPLLEEAEPVPPLSGAHPLGPDLVAHPADPHPPGPIPAGLRVLVVDDQPDIAEGLGLLLRGLVAQVRTVNDGHSALAAFAAEPADALILDIGMPGMDGCELARRLREGWPDLSPLLIAVTGWGSEADRERVRAAGFDRHLVKPVSLEGLRSALAAGRTRPVPEGPVATPGP
jgi:PAS domain S-box-containing protein